MGTSCANGTSVDSSAVSDCPTCTPLHLTHSDQGHEYVADCECRIDVAGVKAHLTNGLLHVHLPLVSRPAATITIQGEEEGKT